MAELAPDPDDFVGQLFRLLEDDGESIAIRYGAITNSSAQWHTRSHAHFDGIGGLAHLIQAMDGHVYSDLPRLAGSSWPSRAPYAAIGLTTLWGEPGVHDAWWHPRPVEEIASLMGPEWAAHWAAGAVS